MKEQKIWETYTTPSGAVWRLGTNPDDTVCEGILVKEADEAA